MRINPKQIEKAMKRMGIQAQEIDAQEVVIKTPEKDIVITNPSVQKINMMGQETFQVSGDVSEVEKGFSEEDVRMVMEQAGVSEEEARNALNESGGIAEAIVKLRKESGSD